MLQIKIDDNKPTRYSQHGKAVAVIELALQHAYR